jgi:hypothetical protein
MKNLLVIQSSPPEKIIENQSYGGHGRNGVLLPHLYAGRKAAPLMQEIGIAWAGRGKLRFLFDRQGVSCKAASSLALRRW